MAAKDHQLGKLLDQNRADGDHNNKEKYFTDREVCRPFLLGICINDLFVNTRQEMGECLKIHSITLKEEYEAASENRDYDFDEEGQEIRELAVKIGEKVVKAESLGDVDESMALLKEVEDIKTKKKRLEDEYLRSLPLYAQQQDMLRVCEVCGAFLSMSDNDRRLADHFGGKLHMGFVNIREKITFLEEQIKERREHLMHEREEREK